MSQESQYLKIIQCLRGIHQAPAKKNPNYFIHKSQLCAIVDAKRLSSLPLNLSKYLEYDEFYIQFDADDKTVLYYAFDIEDYTSGETENEVQGIADWAELEHLFYQFLLFNINDLTSAQFPYSNLNDRSGTNLPVFGPHCPIPSYNRSEFNSDNVQDIERHNSDWRDGQYHQRGKPNYGPQNTQNYNHGQYNSDLWKERSEFNDKLEAFIKENKTAMALDFINETIPQLIRNEKSELVDSILKFIYIEKLNLPIMTGLLETTKNMTPCFGRNDFVEKYKIYLTKIRTRRVMAERFLKRVETNV